MLAFSIKWRWLDRAGRAAVEGLGAVGLLADEAFFHGTSSRRFAVS